MDDNENLINLEKFLENCVAEIPESYWVKTMKDIDEAILCQKMDQTPEVIKELAAVCDPSTLEIFDEPVCELEAICNNPQNSNLTTVRMIKKRKVTSRTWDPMITDYTELFYKPPKEKEVETKIENDLKPLAVDLVLTIHVFDPFSPAVRLKSPHVNQEIHVLGSQRLTELRDLISCASDNVIAGDYSENPKLVPDIRAKDVYKSGFFFIENAFYNDMRNKDNIDYSQCIMEWAASPDVNVGPFTQNNMDETHFIDLSIQLGQPYLYQHQGNCEHIILFTNVRVIHEDDGPVDRYPLLIRKRKRKRNMCRGCARCGAKWIVKASDFATEDPSFFCDECFTMLHYDKNGKKIGNFKAFAFLNALL